jgi:hypothetical protein
MLVDLDPYDLEKVGLLAQARGVGKRPNVKNRRVTGETDKVVDIAGVKGEYAFAKAYDLPIQTWPGIGGDPGYDFLMHGRTVDVKTTFYPKGRLLLPTWQEDHIADVLVLAACPIEVSQVVLCGWTSRKLFMKSAGRMQMRADGPFNLALEQDQLLSMDTLEKTLVEAKGKT